MYAPRQDDGRSAEDVLHGTITPPMFPIELHGIPGSLHFHDVVESEFTIGNPESPVLVLARRVPHVGRALGYRLMWRGVTVTYLSDHQQPSGAEFTVDDGVLELCSGTDLLIHDSQYLPDEFAGRSDWGHCTAEFAVWLAEKSGARRLALFHHDPDHNDDCVDEILATAQKLATTVDVFAAAERTTITVGPASH